jgi:hypothetical protein
MIVVQLSGGLGNQMFQYALGRCLAGKLGCGLKLDLSNYDEYRDRQYELFRYDIHATIASAVDLQRCKGYGLTGRIVMPMLEKLVPNIGVRVVREQSERFDESVLSLKGNIYLIGYWQCERYFTEIADTIRSDLTLTEGLDERDANMVQQIRSTNAISIHFRRGDYVSDPNAEATLGALTTDYYAAAIKHVAARVEKPHFYVFSDDADWTMRNLRFEYPATFVAHNGPGRGVFDMRLMSACRHNIIANSTFSWWAAWLNGNPEKLVIAPSQWYRDASRDAADIVPADWIRI